MFNADKVVSCLSANGIKFIHKFTFEPCSPMCCVIILCVRMIPAQGVNHVLPCLEITDAGINFDR